MTIRLRGPALSVRTCASRLGALIGGERALEASCGTGSQPPVDEVVFESDELAADSREFECEMPWHGPRADVLPGSEAVVQATCGLAHLHGLERGRPRRLGAEVGSVAAGMLASQGVLAALIGHSRGVPVTAIRTSITHAALLSISQYIARATSSDTWSEWMPVTPGPEPGPPFRSADGHWFEIETLDPEAWKRFWGDLGADTALLGRAWTLFRARYSTAKCSMPEGFHGATQGRTLAELTELARCYGVSLSPLRSYREVLAEPGLGNIEFPTITPVPPELRTNPGPSGSKHTPETLPSGLKADLPLRGLRIVEATSRIQGPLAGQLLRMLGANVVRVEPPGGDPGRVTSPLAGGAGALFLCMNRGKEPVELDLAHPAGRVALTDLAAEADVFLHNWRPGRAKEWHLDFENLAPRNPELIYCAASGWGELAPKCPPIGMEFLVQAYAGLGNAIHPEGEHPFPTRLLVTDFMGAMVACEGILAALYRRERGAGGCRVDTSLLAGAISLHAHALEAYSSGEEGSRREGRPMWTPWDVPLQTADGLIFVTISDEAALERLREACGIDGQRRSGEDIVNSVAKRLRSRPAREWQQILLAAEIPCGAVCTDLSELPTNPLLKGCLEPVEDAWMPSTPWRFTTGGS